MKYVASISYGKDSLAMLEAIKLNNLPLDRIIHADIWATNNINADLPSMVKFKRKAKKEIQKRYGIEVEHIRAQKTFEELFYTQRVRGKRKGEIRGFPMTTITNWCTRDLKVNVLKKAIGKNDIEYLGYAIDEPSPKRQEIINNYKKKL